MIRHVLLIKLKENSPEHCEKVRQLLLSMEHKVPTVRAIEVGTDFLHSERSFDICLFVTFDSPAALEEYQRDPYHCDVVKSYIAQTKELSYAVDYEI